MGKLEVRPQSYSSLSLFQNCPQQYKLKYLDGNYSQVSTLALELGTLLHKILELKYQPLEASANPYTQEELLDILQNGYKEEKIAGLETLKVKYFEDYIAQGRKSNLTYGQKITTFINNLSQDSKLEEDWEVLVCELPFNIQYDDQIEINGKIDRVDINKNTGDLRVIDYKSSDAVYEDKDLNNALQMYIYSLAIQNIYNKTPVEYIYDFILLGQKAQALTKKNYKVTMQKKLDKIITELKDNYTSKEFKPKPTPLCYWCPYNKQSCIKDKENEMLCEYYSLWTPTEKTFAVNKPWNVIEGSVPVAKAKKTETKEFIW